MYTCGKGALSPLPHVFFSGGDGSGLVFISMVLRLQNMTDGRKTL